jgi:excisionase family DNA binding protein
MKYAESSIHNDQPGLLSREQAARHLGISTRNLDYLREAGRLPFVQIGRRVVFVPADLEHFVQSRRIEGT